MTICVTIMTHSLLYYMLCVTPQHHLCKYVYIVAWTMPVGI